MAGDIQCSQANPCTAVQLLTQKVGDHSVMLEKLQNRLPLWATMAMTAAGATIGILAGHVKF